MTHLQRIRTLLAGAALILTGIIIPSVEKGYIYVAMIFGLTLLVKGLRRLFYYFTMARLMVGGKAILYRGVIYYEIGVYTLTLTNIPRIYLMLYLIGLHFFLGTVDVLNALEDKRAGSSSWIRKLLPGVINILIAAVCVVFIRDADIAIAVYSAGLVYSGIVQLTNAFRKTAMVYIQ